MEKSKKYEKGLVYKEGKTGRIFIFEHGGLWSEEGISHKLLQQ